MMNKKLLIFAVFLLSVVFFTSAESKTDRQSRKKIERIQKAREDSIDNVKALNAISEMKFALMADRLSLKAASRFVEDNLNFIATDSVNAMVQIVPFVAGFNGLNLKGSLTKTETQRTKKGDTIINLYIFGNTLNAQISITLYKGTNRATATITPNFRGGNVTMEGKIFSFSVFNELDSALKRF